MAAPKLKPQFKVGDLVEVVESAHYLGQVGEISRITDDVVQIDIISKRTITLAKNQVQLVGVNRDDNQNEN